MRRVGIIERRKTQEERGSREGTFLGQLDNKLHGVASPPSPLLLLLPFFLCHFLASNPNFIANRQPNLGFPTKISTKQFSRTCRFPLSVFFPNCREQGEPFPWNDKMAEQKKKVKRDSNERLGLRTGSIDGLRCPETERCKSWG